MSPTRFFICQFILFFSLLFLNAYFDPYISKPFSRVDLIAICIKTPLFILIVILNGKLYIRFNARLRNKVFLSISAFILAIIFIVLLDNIWFQITGKMFFN